MREFVDGDFPFANDLNAILQALADQALVDNGCSVGDGGTNDMTVDVTAGDVRINGSSVSVGAQTTTLASADSSNDRYDLVVVDDTGSVSNVTGTASSTPKAPSIPANTALLAVVFVQAGTSGVTDGDIYGARAVYALPGQFTSHAGNASAHHSKPTSVDATDPNDVLGSRSVGTWYQNNTGYPLYVHATERSFEQTGKQLHINSTQNNNIVSEDMSFDSSAGDDQAVNVAGVVPPTWYYKVANSRSYTGALDHWIEQELRVA